MPISREEFESGRLDLTVPIRQFLEVNPELAFSAEDIVDRLAEIVGRNATESEIIRQLDTLVRVGKVLAKDFGSRRWLPARNTPALSIVGPTAVGKSALALHLARTFEGEIVNADSRLVYRFMDVGTAKPSSEDRTLLPHHLVDIIDPDEEFNLALFLDLAHRAIEDICSRAKLPIIVGGTGQYLWALLEGWQVPHVRPNPELRADMEAVARRDGPQALHEALRKLDPEAAYRIDHRNVRRVIRALEVYDATGAAPTDPRRRPPVGPFLIIGLTAARELLYQRIDQRVDWMLESGLVEEVRQLLRLGYSANLPCMSSMGYKEISLHLKGELTLEEASQRIKYATHRLARRQYSWFRPSDPRIHWLELGGDVNRRAEALVRETLRGLGTYGKIGSTAEEPFR